MEVEDVEERFDWKAGDTSYEESYSVKERVLENAAAGNYYWVKGGLILLILSKINGR